MLLAYDELVEQVSRGVISDVRAEDVNPASIDVRLGNTFLVEVCTLKHRLHRWLRRRQPVDLALRESVKWAQKTLQDNEYIDIHPGQFMLAHTLNFLNMPNNISGEYSLKSSLARNGLNHLLAGWIDPGFNSSVLTLEFKNNTSNHVLRLRPGMPIGQIKLFRHAEVPADKSYSARGRYNGDSSVSGIRE